MKLSESRMLAWSSPAALASTIDRPSPGQPSRFQIPPHVALLDRCAWRIARGDLKRLIITMPPRHGKSWYVSRALPAWWLGTRPDDRVALISYESDFAATWGRHVRNIIEEHGPTLFGVNIDPQSSAAHRWNLYKRLGGMVTTGIRGPLTGRGVDLMVIDDPIKNMEEAFSTTLRERNYRWYQGTARTRLEPRGAVVLMHCMTGDTPVLMADGTETALQDIRPGDRIATYDDGAIAAATVKNWAKQGHDRLLAITTRSGRMVRANARHPFLVQRDGTLAWRRTATLRVGDALLRVTGGSGGALCAAPMVATSQPNVRGYAPRTTARIDGRGASAPLQPTAEPTDQRISGIDTGLTSRTTRDYWPTNEVFARSASSHPSAHHPTGGTACASITVTKAKRCAVSCATAATSRSGMGGPPTSSPPRRNTLGVTPDPIVSIIDAGIGEVFDIEVEHTANFIANGLVSHNTRWHEDDLAGRLIRESDSGEGEKWEVLNLAAIAGEDDPLGREPGEPLWAARYDLDALEALRRGAGSYVFESQYQGSPRPEAGGFFKRAWFRYYREAEPGWYQLDDSTLVDHRTLVIFATMDLAASEKDAADWTVIAVWGVTSGGRLLLLHIARFKLEGGQRIIAEAHKVGALYPGIVFWIEDSGMQIAIVRDARDSGLLVRPLEADRDKVTRALSATVKLEAGEVFFPQTAPWLGELEAELLVFPAGTHDDQVDVVAYGIEKSHDVVALTSILPRTPDLPEENIPWPITPDLM